MLVRLRCRVCMSLCVCVIPTLFLMFEGDSVTYVYSIHFPDQWRWCVRMPVRVSVCAVCMCCVAFCTKSLQSVVALYV